MTVHESTETIQSRFTCYGCGAPCTMSIPEGPDPAPSLCHEMPMCAEFEAVVTVEDATRFLRRCREGN